MNAFKKILILFLFLITVCTVVPANTLELTTLSDDVEIIKNTRKAIQDVLIYVKSKPDLFPSKKTTNAILTSREQRKEIWLTWQMFLDRMLVLDKQRTRYLTFYNNSEDKEIKRQAFRVNYAAYLAQYRYAMEFITLMENDPSMHTILNEEVPELGLKAGNYKALKFRFLNIIRGLEFAKLETIYHFYKDDLQLSLTAGIKEDSKTIWEQAKGNGPKHTALNALKIIEDSSLSLLAPAQKELFEFMGDVKVLRYKTSLISTSQISEMKKLLLPGDILLERREWYLSNIGLPGYWPHAALYIGTPEERNSYFNNKKIKEYYKKYNGNLDTYLKQEYPKAYQLGIKPQEHDHIPKVIEAISEGVSFTTLEHSLDADSVVILRPRLSKLEKAIAIERAYHYSGRPYDFNFDFVTDAELVCSELIYKVYEPNKNYKGLVFPLQKIVGRQVTTPNTMAKMFDEQYEKPKQQLDFIAFYDGHEWKNEAIKTDVNEFRESWKRSKWFIWIQDTPLNK